MAALRGPLSPAWESVTAAIGLSSVPLLSEHKGADRPSSPPTAGPSGNTIQNLSILRLPKRFRFAFGIAVVFTLLSAVAYTRYPIVNPENFRATTGTNLTDLTTPNTTTTPSAGPAPVKTDQDVDWSRFAYTQYVTNQDYLCNSVMIFETLWRLGSRADRVMMYPRQMMDPGTIASDEYAAQLLIKARDSYNVSLVPVDVQSKQDADITWAESYTKLLAFNQTQYDRVLNVDSDATILQTMDELFFSPPSPVAMPRAYWLLPDQKTLSSQLMLIQPSATEFERVKQAIDETTGAEFDMEIVNRLYSDTAMVLPHRPYDLLTGEFRGTKHTNYLGSDREVWDPLAVYKEAKLLHFSDWPVPKPWLPMDPVVKLQNQPACETTVDGREDCTSRDLWNSFYDDFKTRRMRVCGAALSRLKR